MSDARIDDELEVNSEPGLSSAMHDITMLAKSYRQAGVTAPPQETLELGGVSMTPAFLLQPRVAPRRESWKSVAFGLMVLLGLSTSALALSLYSAAGNSKAETTPLLLDLDAAALPSASPEPTPDIVMAPEPPIYRVATLPGSTVRPDESREQVTPLPTTSTAARKPKAKASRITETNTCDEVACLIDGSDACCLQYESVRAEQSELVEEPTRPYRLTRSEIMIPMQSIAGRVERCADTHGVKDLAMVKLVIAQAGTIESLQVDQGSAAFQSCVEREVRTLQFRQLSQSFRFSYPYTF